MGNKNGKLRPTKEIPFSRDAKFLAVVEGKEDVRVLFKNSQRRGVSVFSATDDKVVLKFVSDRLFTHAALSPNGDYLVVTHANHFMIFTVKNSTLVSSGTLEGPIKYLRWVAKDFLAVATKQGVFAVQLDGTVHQLVDYESHAQLLRFCKCECISVDSTKRLWVIFGYQRPRYHPVVVIFDCVRMRLNKVQSGYYRGVFKSWRDKGGDVTQYLFLHQMESDRQTIKVFCVRQDAELGHMKTFSIPSEYDPEEHVIDLKLSDKGVMYVISSAAHVTVVSTRDNATMLEFTSNALITKSLIPVCGAEERFYCLTRATMQGVIVSIADVLKHCEVKEGVTPYIYLDSCLKLILPSLSYLEETDSFQDTFGEESTISSREFAEATTAERSFRLPSASFLAQPATLTTALPLGTVQFNPSGQPPTTMADVLVGADSSRPQDSAGGTSLVIVGAEAAQSDVFLEEEIESGLHPAQELISNHDRSMIVTRVGSKNLSSEVAAFPGDGSGTRSTSRRRCLDSTAYQLPDDSFSVAPLPPVPETQDQELIGHADSLNATTTISQEYGRHWKTFMEAKAGPMQTISGKGQMSRSLTSSEHVREPLNITSGRIKDYRVNMSTVSACRAKPLPITGRKLANQKRLSSTTCEEDSLVPLLPPFRAPFQSFVDLSPITGSHRVVENCVSDDSTLFSLPVAESATIAQPITVAGTQPAVAAVEVAVRQTADQPLDAVLTQQMESQFLMDKTLVEMSLLRSQNLSGDRGDLFPNGSEERLQNSSLIQRIKNILTNRIQCCDEQKGIKPEEFAHFYSDYRMFSLIFKEELESSEDQLVKEEFAKLMCYESSMRSSGEKATLTQYAERMKEGQTDIYYLAAPNRALAEKSPYLEAVRKEDVEVLFCYDPHGELGLIQLRQFDKKHIISVEQVMWRSKEEEPGQLETSVSEGGMSRQAIDDFSDWLKTSLQGKAHQVKSTNRLTSHACVISIEEMGVARHFVKTHALSEEERFNLLEPTLVINPNHMLIQKLNETMKSNPDLARFLAVQLFLTAMVTAGFPVYGQMDVAKMNELLVKALEKC